MGPFVLIAALFAKKAFVNRQCRPLMHQHTCRQQKFHPIHITLSYAALLLSSTSAILLISTKKATHHWVSVVHRQCVTLTRGAHGHNGNYKALPDHRANQLQYVIVCKNGPSSSLAENASCNSLVDHSLRAAEPRVNRFNEVSSLLTKNEKKNFLLLLCTEDNHWKVNWSGIQQRAGWSKG